VGHNDNEALFDEGFYGERFREFETLGVEAVRHDYERSNFPNEMHHHAAGVWLGRKEASATRRANIKSNAALVISAFALLLSFMSFLER
jgi:hypothetical protein